MDTQSTNLNDSSFSPAISTPAEALLLLDRPICHIKKIIQIELTEHTYLPKVLSPRSDWVASVATPAFLAFKEKYQIGQKGIDDFLTIGTGSGIDALDALAAIEVLTPKHITITDLHKSVVDTAIKNIRTNTSTLNSIEIDGFVGNLATPLLQIDRKYDLIYENLPNIPLIDGVDLFEGQNSSSFIQPTEKDLPETVKTDLLELHYMFLNQAHNLLKNNGRILCSIGSRVPIKSILEMVKQANYIPNIRLYTWKIQSEPAEVVGSYAEHQRRGLGPFHFYPIEILENTFSGLSSKAATANAFEIEQKLKPYAIDAETSIALVNKGKRLGHTVIVVEATLPNNS